MQRRTDYWVVKVESSELRGARDYYVCGTKEDFELLQDQSEAKKFWDPEAADRHALRVMREGVPLAQTAYVRVRRVRVRKSR